jgi:hypothetical protein
MGVARDVLAFILASGTAITMWYRKRSARFWPIAYGKVEYVSSGENNGTWLTDITYSYSVANEFYSGQHQIKTIASGSPTRSWRGGRARMSAFAIHRKTRKSRL